MFQFTRLLQTSLCIQLAAVGNPGIITCLSTPPGFSQTSTPFNLLTPRHPPCALSRLVIEIPNSEQSSWAAHTAIRQCWSLLKTVHHSFIRKVIHLTISHDQLTSLRTDCRSNPLQSVNHKESYLRIHSQITTDQPSRKHRSVHGWIFNHALTRSLNLIESPA